MENAGIRNADDALWAMGSLEWYNLLVIQKDCFVKTAQQEMDWNPREYIQ